jgi:hypothetical protein
MASVADLSLATFSVPGHSTSELLRTLSRMAASKPTSWLFWHPDPLCHCACVGDLSRWSGLFPFRRRSLAPAVSLACTPRLAFGVWLSVVTCVRPLAHPVRYLQPVDRRLHLHAFRGEPAISGFGWHFTPTHRSSPRFATRVGASLDEVSPSLHSAHA